MTRSPLLLLATLGSLGLLIVFLVILAWRHEGQPLTTALVLSDKSPEDRQIFRSGFGRLDELVPFAGGISPVAPEVAASLHGPEFRDREWVRSRGPESWTLQYMAGREEAAVKRFLAGLENRASYVYFEYPQNGQTWFVVTSGDYVTREMAEGVAGTETMTGEVRPFPRRFGVYQEALDAEDSAAVVAPSPTPLEASPAQGAADTDVSPPPEL